MRLLSGSPKQKVKTPRRLCQQQLKVQRYGFHTYAYQWGYSLDPLNESEMCVCKCRLHLLISHLMNSKNGRLIWRNKEKNWWLESSRYSVQESVIYNYIFYYNFGDDSQWKQRYSLTILHYSFPLLQEREKQLSSYEKSTPARPKSSRAARTALSQAPTTLPPAPEKADNQKTMEMRKAIANRLKAEVIGK